MKTFWIIFATFMVFSHKLSSAITNHRHFRHISYQPHTNVPLEWEQGLRESIVQALHREHYGDPNLRKHILNAPLLGKQNRATPFGDIAILARGQLFHKNNAFIIVQDQYENDCDDCHNIKNRCGYLQCETWKPKNGEQLIALWTVKRIRHRNYNNSPNFETEFTVTPMRYMLHHNIVSRDGRFNYAIPGHVFVMKNHHSTNFNNIKPNKHYYLPYTSSTSTTVVPTEHHDDHLYNELIHVLNQKTTTQPHGFVTEPFKTSTKGTTVVTEIPKTTLVQLPTGQVVPIHTITTPYITKSTTGYVTVRFPTSGTTTKYVPITTSTTSTTTVKPPVKTTLHFFSATEEESEKPPKTTYVVPHIVTTEQYKSTNPIVLQTVQQFSESTTFKYTTPRPFSTNIIENTVVPYTTKSTTVLPTSTVQHLTETTDFKPKTTIKEFEVTTKPKITTPKLISTTINADGTVTVKTTPIVKGTTIFDTTGYETSVSTFKTTLSREKSSTTSTKVPTTYFSSTISPIYDVESTKNTKTSQNKPTESTFLNENVDVGNEPQYTKPVLQDVSIDDIFGVQKSSTKPIKSSTTQKYVVSDIEHDLFGDRKSKSLKGNTKVIYSNFFEASTPTLSTVTTEDYKTTLPQKRVPITKQSYSTSISFQVNKRNKTKVVPTTVYTTTIVPFDVTTESVTKGTKEIFDDIALNLINQAKSIDILTNETTEVPLTTTDSTTLKPKAARRRKFISRVKRPLKRTKKGKQQKDS